MNAVNVVMIFLSGATVVTALWLDVLPLTIVATVIMGISTLAKAVKAGEEDGR